LRTASRQKELGWPILKKAQAVGLARQKELGWPSMKKAAAASLAQQKKTGYSNLTKGRAAALAQHEKTGCLNMAKAQAANVEMGFPGAKAANKNRRDAAGDKMENELCCVLLDESMWVHLKCANQDCENVHVAKHLIEVSSPWTKDIVGNMVYTGRQRCGKCEGIGRDGKFDAPASTVNAAMLYNRKMSKKWSRP
jgi:hypothetical protein